MNRNSLLDPLAVSVLVVSAVLFPWTGVWECRRLVRYRFPCIVKDFML
jgi:hypothetical protein